MHPAKNGGITLPAPQNALKGHRTSFFLQLPTQIPVSFALPFQLKLSRTHTKSFRSDPIGNRSFVNAGVKLGHGAAQNWATLGLRETFSAGGGQSAALSM